MKRRLLLAALGFTLVLPVYARKRPDPALPLQAPGFELPGTTGTVSLEALRGKIVYVDFWASWCVSCRSSFPWLRTLHERYAGRGLVVVAIDLDKDRAAADRFLEDFPAPFLVAFDPTGSTAEAFNVPAMPSSYLIGATGTILFSQMGFDPRESATIEARIKEALPR